MKIITGTMDRVAATDYTIYIASMFHHDTIREVGNKMEELDH
jgi:hypothetical protein